jgi:uncharacterized membrane protein
MDARSQPPANAVRTLAAADRAATSAAGVAATSVATHHDSMRHWSDVSPRPVVKTVGLWLMALFYIGGGINHFVSTPFYLQMMPPYLPAHLALVYVSGVAELALGIGLLIPATRRLAAWGVIALLIAIYPANLYMWTSHMAVNGKVLPTWAHVLRLFIQLLLMYWAWTVARAPRPAPATRQAS